MTNNNNISPIFPIHHQPHDQIPYFQVLEDSRHHKRHTSSFKKIKKTRKRWWKQALHFFKRKCTPHVYAGAGPRALSAPVYWAEDRSWSSAQYHHTATSGPSTRSIARTITATRKGDVNIPYVSLNELKMDQTHNISVSRMPIYLVT